MLWNIRKNKTTKHNKMKKKYKNNEGSIISLNKMKKKYKNNEGSIISL